MYHITSVCVFEAGNSVRYYYKLEHILIFENVVSSRWLTRIRSQ